MSRAPISLSVVIPAYNEEKRLPRTLERLAAWKPAAFSPLQIIVVDDGSADATRAVVKAHMERDPRLELVTVPHGGVMNAVIAGYRAAKNDVVGNMDADGATDPAEFERFAPELDAADVVTGSRQLRGDRGAVEGKSLLRRFLSKGFSRLFLTLFRVGVHDPQIGCRLFKRQRLLEILPLLTSRYDGIKIAEMLVKAYGLGQPIKELPVAYRHDEDSRLVPRRPVGVVVKTFAALLVMWIDAEAQYRAGRLKRAPARFGLAARLLGAALGGVLRRLS